jgi:NDP-sugar pyrophosphorylase family protein
MSICPASGFFDIKERLIPALYRAGERVVPYRTHAAIPRVLSASTYLALNEWMIERQVGQTDTPAEYVRSNQALIHRDAWVASDAVLVGPVIVSGGARIQSEAVVVGPTSIGRDVVIGSSAFVSRTAVWRRAFIGDHATADRCLIADDGVLEARIQSRSAVVVGGRRLESAPATASAGLMGLLETPAMDVARKVGRLLSGAEWSRSPAAQ